MKYKIITAFLAITVMAGCKKEVPDKKVDACPMISVLDVNRVVTTVNGFTSPKDYYTMHLIKNGDETFYKAIPITQEQFSKYKVGQMMCDFN